MAEKKTASKAEKMVSEAKKKTSTTGTSSKSTTKKTGKKTAAPAAKTPKVKTEYENPIPVSFVVALLSIFLFILFVIISVNPDGALLKVVKSVVLGLMGKAGFYFSIPALLYLFILNIF